MWKKSKKDFEALEESLINCRINLLRKAAKIFLRKKRRVFFKENKIVHWGEGNFGNLLIEGEEQVDKLFGEYVPEIAFFSKLDEKDLKHHLEIKETNLNLIKYQA